MELTDYLKIARAHWRVIVAVAMLGLCAASIASLMTTPRYTANTSVLFAVQNANSAGDLAQGSTYAEKQVQSFAEVATAPVVLQPVIDRLRLDTDPGALAQRVNATVPQRTVIVKITVTDPSPGRAADIANAIGDELPRATAKLTPKTATGEPTVQATVIAPALPPERPTTPRVAQNLAVGLLLGLAVGYGLCLLREQLDTRVHDSADVAQVTDTPVMGTVPLDGKSSSRLAVETAPQGYRAEAYRRVATTLQFLNVDSGSRALMVTSSIPGEGKTTTVTNLALTLAENHQRVLIIDADLRRPKVGDSFGIDSTAGLTTVLIGKADLSEVVQPYGPDSTLHILPSGAIPPNPAELLGSRRMQTLIDRAIQEYDTVLLDSPPVLPVADSGVLAGMVGAVIVMVGAGQTHRAHLEQTLDSLTKSGAHVAGIIVNKGRRTATNSYGYYVDDYKPKLEPRESLTPEPSRL